MQHLYAPAYFDLGYFLVEGIGTKKDPAAAFPWLEKATANRIEAYNLLAMIYLQGKGITRNYPELVVPAFLRRLSKKGRRHL